MQRTENVELTVLCLLQNNDRILLQNRVNNDWQGYTLPGGHVESWAPSRSRRTSAVWIRFWKDDSEE